MRIEYEDQEILVIYKEAGLPVQTGRTSQKDVVSLLKNHLARNARTSEAEAKGAEIRRAEAKGAEEGNTAPYLGIVHRLDQPVEGLLVFAKTPGSAAALSAQAASKDGMEKVYQAVVCLSSSSYPLAIDGMKKPVTMIDWLGRDKATNMAYIASEDEPGAKRAELSFRTLWIRDGRALLEIRLRTGRHHQIRIQMANAGMPLLGDRKYGELAGRYPVRVTPEEMPYPLCLCAWRLSFQHPVSGKKMTFCVEPAFLEKAGVILGSM